MRAFDFEHYVKNPAASADTIALIAKVWLDGDTYVVVPNPKNELNAYRFAKRDVHIVDVLPSDAGGGADAEPLYHVAVRKEAPCARFSIGSASQYWSGSSEEAIAIAATLRARIVFQSNGEGTLTYNGLSRPCLGKTGLKYPVDLTINVGDKYLRRFSNEFNVWMNFAALIWGQRGIYIHEGPATLADNGGESAGCIHVASPHAEAYFDWITGRTRIEIAYPW